LQGRSPASPPGRG